MTASKRLNGLPFASAQCTRGSTSKNARVCFQFFLTNPELFTRFPKVPSSFSVQRESQPGDLGAVSAEGFNVGWRVPEDTISLAQEVATF